MSYQIEIARIPLDPQRAIRLLRWVTGDRWYQVEIQRWSKIHQFPSMSPDEARALLDILCAELKDE